MNSWQLLESAVNVVSRTYIYGPPGTGKSRFAFNALKKQLANKPVAQVTLNEDTVVQELLGHYVPKENMFQWHDGPVTRSFREGGGLVINELSRGTGAVKDMFLAILDDPEIALLSLPNNEDLTSGQGFRVIITANTPPNDLDEALQDRLDVVIQVKEPHPELIDYLDSLMKNIGSVVVDSYKDPTRAISPRRIMALHKLLKSGLSIEESIFSTFGERASDINALFKLRGINHKTVN